MKKKSEEYYSQKFYSKHIEGSVRSAEIILNLLYKLYQPKSVVELGCGRGSWLSVAESLGSNELKAYDGAWVKKEELLSQNIDFTAVDFEKGVDVKSGFDLAISLEVAEHISESNAAGFVKALCKASDVVLFGAAIKYQGGKNHINEQRQSYWVKLFKENGYECFDIFRKEVWDNDAVEWWYRQNIFLFINQASSMINMDGLKRNENLIIDIVHPLSYEGKMKLIENPDRNFCMRCLRRFIKNKFRA